MLQDGNYLVPHLNGSPFLDKPPLVPWLVALSYQVFGIHPGVARLISVLAILWSAIVVGWITQRLFTPDQGILAALLLLGAPGMQYYGRMLMTDTVFMALTLTAIAMFVEGYVRDHRGWYRLGFVACGLAVLTRGLIGAIYPLGALMAFFLLIDRRAWQRVPWTTGFLLLCLVTVPWFVLTEMHYPGFLDLFIVQHHLDRLNGANQHHFVAIPRWQILLGFGGFLGPMCFFLPWAIGTVKGKHAAHHLPGLLAFLVLASVLLATGRNQPYTLPALPPLVVLIGAWLGGLAKAETPPIWARLSALMLGCFALAILALLFQLPALLRLISPLLAPAPTPLTVQLCMFIIAVLALGGSLLLWRGRGIEVGAMLAMLMLPGGYMLTHVQQQLAPLESRASLARIVAHEVPPTWPVVIANPRDHLFEGVGAWGFYAHRQVLMVSFQNPLRGPFRGVTRPEWILDKEDFIEMWTSGRPLALVATPQALAQLPFAPLPPPRARDEKFALWIVHRGSSVQVR
jgi:4-amino-4-deoxy-L-arabinose transferase-like glycosyltransferase